MINGSVKNAVKEMWDIKDYLHPAALNKSKNICLQGKQSFRLIKTCRYNLRRLVNKNIQSFINILVPPSGNVTHVLCHVCYTEINIKAVISL